MGVVSAAAKQLANKARRELALIIDREFGDVDDFRRFLAAGGYDDVLRAVPVGPPDVYRRELLFALERRGQIDSRFLTALTKERPAAADAVDRVASALGLKLAGREAAPEKGLPEIELRAVSGEAAPRPATRGRTRRAATRGFAAEAVEAPEGWLSKDRLASLLEMFGDAHMPGLATLPYGSPWGVVLQEAGAESGNLSAVIAHLAADSRPEAKEALAWLLGRIAEMPGVQTEDVALLSGARDSLGAGHAATVPVLKLETFLPSREEILPISVLSQALEAARGVARVRGPAIPPASSTGCTGWLLTPHLLVVPAHVFASGKELHLDEREAQDRARSFEVDFDYDGLLVESRMVRGEGLALLDAELDLALLRLSEVMSDRAPLRVRTEAIPDGYRPLTLIHHPELRPKAISIEGGRVLASDGHQVLYLLATRPGSAGAPVLDADWRVLATHSAFRHVAQGGSYVPAKSGTATPALLQRLRERWRDGIWREVVGAQPGLKSVDQTIRQQLVERERKGRPPAVPFVIELVSEASSLDDVPDLDVRSRSGTLVTAVGTHRSLDSLELSPQVFAVEASVRAGTMECIASVAHVGTHQLHVPPQPGRQGERGDRALVAVIDAGVDVLHRAFRDAAGGSRIVAFWDQRDLEPAADGLARSVSAEGRALVIETQLRNGALYVKEDIDRFIAGEPLPASFPPLARMRHGTAVCSIAAGRRTGDDPEQDFGGGVAPEAGLVVVRYDLRDTTIGYNSGHIEALGFIDRMATKLDKPVVVNISNGMNTGAHDGTSTVEVSCEQFTRGGTAPGRVIVKSAGNERQNRRHAVVAVANGGLEQLPWKSAAVPDEDPPLRAPQEVFELWFDSADRYRFRVKTPADADSPWVGGDSPGILDERLPNGNRLQMRLEPYHPSGNGSLHFELFPGELAAVEEGTWVLEIEGVDVRTGKEVHAWVEGLPHRDVRFLDHVEDKVTVTIPGTADSVIVVGAVAVETKMRLHKWSSYGPTRGGRVVEKPDLVAPGVGIRAARAGTGGGAEAAVESPTNTGTSFAAPHVTGAIALLLSARAKQPGLPQFNSLQIRGALFRSARYYNGHWHHGTGWGQLDVGAFVAQLLGNDN